MYKTLLRTLSALSIVTITASAGFAAHEADELNIDCADPANTYIEKCRAKAGIKPVTTDVWKDSFGSNSVPPPVEPDTTSRTDQFVLPADSLDHYTNKQRVNLKFDANNDGTDTIVGSSIFYMNKTGDRRNFYAGIRIGADLGEPIVEAFPEVVWKTRFKAVGTRVISKRDFYINEIFDLTVKFIGTSDGTQTRTMGEISGYIQHGGYYGFKIDAQFNDDGVITTGTGGITYGRFENAGAEPTETVVGNLTGIIGDRGALGAFHSDSASSDQILGFAGGFRANGFSEDELVALRKCVLDPFHGQCSEDKFDDLKEARIELCIEGDNASDTNQIECHNAVLAEGCIRNPFQTKCTGDMSDFNKYSEVARANRIAFCDSRDKVENALCKGDIVTDVCADDPFHAICGDDYDGARKGVVKACLTAGNCAGKVLERPNAATWEHVVTTREENPIVLGDARSTTRSEIPFLKNIETARSNRSIAIGGYSAGGSTYKSLDLSTAKFNISGTATDLGGDAEDGVAIFWSWRWGDQTESSWYSGIYSTTDLGVPLTKPLANEPKTAIWVGSFRGGSSSVEDFVLEVNFEGKSIEAFIGNFYLVKGDYDDNGVISGTVINGYFIDDSRDKPSYRGADSPLTGLIGKEGAVGVFVGPIYSGGFVARPSVEVDGAVSFLDRTCARDPFHKYCYLSKERKARITLCSTDDNALNALVGDTNCVTAAESDPCILHPFDEVCKPTATSHYQIARENRSAFCNKSTNKDSTLCSGAERVALCSYNPFHTLCDNANGLYDNARKVVCRSELDSGRCANYQPSGNVTTASWLSSFYKDNGVVLPTEPDTVRPRNQFLQGTEKGLDNGEVEISTNNTSGESLYGSLNLNTDTFDGLELGRDREDAADDGVAFFLGVNGASYAGIFSGTDLGAPLVETTTGGKFYGQFQVEDFKTDFTLDIDFNAESKDGTVGMVEAFVYTGFGPWHYLLKGDFDRNGVISGTVVEGRFLNRDRIVSYILGTSVLTGLIGAEGAVGAFIGDSLYGGFVASSKSVADVFDPNVKFSDWVRSFDEPPYHFVPWDETQQTLFLQGTETGLRAYISDAVRPVSPLTLANVRTDGEVADGVAYEFGTRSRDYNRETRSYDTITKHHVAGILSGTNLGAALPTVPAGADGNAITAIWDGKLGLVANAVEIPKRDIKLTVDFTNTNITIADTKTDDNKHFVSFDGLGWDEHGLITGNITYDATPTLQTNGSYAASDGSEGIVRGLIGQQGAVGAFRSTHVDNPTDTHTSYAGGFVAAPVVDYSVWEHSFGTGGLPSVPTTAPKPKNQFLQNGVAALRGNGFNPVDPASLDGTSITFGGVALSGGEATDGVTFASATRGVGTERANYYYAELSSTTNLGSPLSQTSGRATATGLFRFVNNYAVQRAVDFKLKITFGDGGAGRINAFIPANLASLSNAFFLTGTFDGSGVIKGDIYNNSHLKKNTTSAQIDNDPMLRKNHGIIRGLIGQQGAVGAFISDATGSSGYAGGFVADAPQADISIDYLDWVASSFATPLVSTPTLVITVPVTTPKNQFLKDGGTDLSDSDFNVIAKENLNLKDATYDGTLLDVNGDVADGVAFSRGTPDGESIRRFYAEVLNGTNLGEPITDGTKDGSWKGRLGFISVTENARMVDFMLNVSFGSTTSNAAGDINATIDPILQGSNPFVLTGTFDNRGVIKGTASDLATRTPNGTLTGLIGQQGAVGAFISDSTTGVYSGGFVAVPPAETASP